MSGRKEFRALIDPSEVRSMIGDLSIAPDPELVTLEEASGRILAERVTSTMDVPGFDRASMDGYAVRAEETFGANEGDPVRLNPIDTVHAGERPQQRIKPGTTAEISTGAVLPPGADAVVMVERTYEHEDVVFVETSVAPGDHVMVAGADIGAGQWIASPGRVLTAREIATFAAIGRAEVAVRAKPRVGIISTGDELVRPGEELDHDRGQIYDVNSHAVAAAVDAAGGAPHVYPHVGDDYDRMAAVLERASTEQNLVLSSGSTSASAVDVIYDVIEEHGELLAHGVAVKPGKPMLVGTLGDGAVPFIGLPGYPVSALMVFRRFVAPRIRQAAGRDDNEGEAIGARMIVEERFDEGRMRLLPVGTVRDGRGDLLAYPVDKGSGATTSLADADGVVEVPADTAYVEPDELVTVHLFEETIRPPSVLAIGEDDPTFSAVLDSQEHPRFLPVGTREGIRRFSRGIPDVVVVAGEERPASGVRLATWRREWGLLVPPGNPDDVTGLADIVDRDLHFANLESTALRTALDEHLEALADDRGLSLTTLTTAITGYGMGRRAHESAARQIIHASADVGLGIGRIASRLSLDFVRIDDQPVQVIAREDRTEKPGVKAIASSLNEVTSGDYDSAGKTS